MVRARAPRRDRRGPRRRHRVLRIGTQRIAAALGLAKDTVARALRRLADADLVTYVPGRTDDGRFAPSHYRLTLPPDVFLDLPVADTRRLRDCRSPARPSSTTAATRPSCRSSTPVPNAS